MLNVNIPITVFDVENMGLNKNNFIHQIRESFYELPWDFYDVRKAQLNYLESTANKKDWNAVPFDSKVDYYEGKIDLSFLQSLLKKLSKKELEKFNLFKPSRRRSAARFIINFNKDHGGEIERMPVDKFVQRYARIENKNKFDYRKCSRIFSETRSEIIETDQFVKLIKEICLRLRAAREGATNKFDIVLHHTYVEARQEHFGDNSPEGIHQDGYDYIVSALVIERKNIVGGMSQIYLQDKKTKLFATELQAGQGILQPDKDSPFWHHVTPFSVITEADKGHRSTIGFDITLL